MLKKKPCMSVKGYNWDGEKDLPDLLAGEFDDHDWVVLKHLKIVQLHV